MRAFRHLRSALARLMLAGLGVLCFAQQLWAQEEKGPQEKSYSLPYLLVVLMIILGLTLALRPSLRQKEFRPPAD